MNTKVLIDSRWAGNTGIGRLYQEVMDRKPPHVMDVHIESEMRLGSLYSPFMLGKAIRSSHADVFYSPSFMPPAFSNIPFVITIHDLMHLFYYSSLHKIYYQQVIARLAKKAKKIITVSYHSKQQLTQLLGIDEHLITVIYNGVDKRFAENENRIKLERPYLLYVGNRRKNKNIPAMLRAFAQAKIDKEIIFALSGEPDPILLQEAEHLGIQERIKFLGFIQEETLPQLYKGALVTMYVSLMEGFGLPILESMASRTPVLTSNVSSLPEIAGSGALCVDPFNINEMAEGIKQLVNNNQLRNYYIEEGTKRIDTFQWEHTGIQTWKAILS
ncbi:glycosyltransferase family 1 protein [Olivibacter sp. CPCC 100613]|uniref:glycosyltransferase family 4 protein n=1 Tax=Olivibacter sp. CPCC 100613 TaxID=3079931 RepID=UPI002FF51B76